MTPGRRPRLRRCERGLSLPELLLGTVLVSTLAGAIGAALLVVMGPDDAANDRLRSSHDTNLAALYVPDDVQSAVSVPGGTASCGGTPIAGTTVLRLAMANGDSVAYQLLDEDDERRLVRFRCHAGVLDRLVVAHALCPDAVACAGQPAAAAATQPDQRVVLTLRGADGSVRTIAGTRRTPPAASECVVTSPAVVPATVALDATDGLSTDVTVTVGHDGPCAGLVLAFSRAGTPETATLSGDPAVVTFPAGDAWSLGTHPLEVTLGSETVATGTLAVTPFEACTVSAVTATPSTVVRLPTGALAGDVVVDVVAADACNVLELAYRPDPGGPEQVLTLGNGAPYSATIAAAAHATWVTGNRPLDVRVPGTTTVLATTNLTVTGAAGCVGVSVTATPSPADRTNNGNPPAPLADAVTVTVTTTGTCTALVLQVPVAAGTTPQTVSLSGGGPGTFTAVIPANNSNFRFNKDTTVTLTVVGAITGTTTGSLEIS